MVQFYTGAAACDTRVRSARSAAGPGSAGAVDTVLLAGKLRIMSAETATATVRAPKGIVDSVRKFVTAHGGSAQAVLQPVGRRGIRLTLVGADGVLGDRMVADIATAQAVVAEVAELTTADGWERDLVAKTEPRTGHWAKMAGWVAGQTRFPKARNEG